MFEDENDPKGLEREKSYVSNKEALTGNSAVKAAIFVFGLMLCIIIIYVLVLGGGSEEPQGTTATVTTPASSGATQAPTNASPGSTSPAGTTAAPTATEEPFLLKRGVTSQKVQELQALLKQKKYMDESVPLAQEFGPATEAAVKKFQKANGLTETGEVDNALFSQIQSAAEYEEPFELKRGTESDKVKELQTLLIEKKYLDLGGEPTTRTFGPATETAVKAFQKANGQAETGIVNNQLFNMIKQAAPNTGASQTAAAT